MQAVLVAICTHILVPSPIDFEILMDAMARDSSHVLVFCVNLEVHISVLVANYSCSFELVVGEKIII